MTVPATFDVTILVNDVDVTAYVPFDSLSLDDYARQVSTLRMQINNPTGVTPTRLHTVVMTWNFDDSIIFTGYLMTVETRKRDNGITIIYDCECADRKILLQRTVIGGNEFTGSDLDILDDLLTNAYPDLSTLFDFATDVTSFADGLDFPVEDGTNLLDALNDLADLTDADWRMDTPTGGAGEFTYIIQSTQQASAAADSAIETTGGSGGGNCARMQDASMVTTLQKGNTLDVIIDFPAPVDITAISVDYYYDYGTGIDTPYASMRIMTDDTFTVTIYSDASQSAYQAYHTITVPGADPDLPYMGAVQIAFRVELSFVRSATDTNVDLRIDNIDINNGEYILDFDNNTGQGADAPTELQWNNTPDLADFDIDVQTGNEYAADIDFSIGALDDFNSVTVIGGYEEIAIEKALDSDGVRDHIALPYPVKTLAVYVNTGTDTTPVWGSALALGAWGSDLLTSGGGSKDVLLDSVHNVLFFDTAPSNLVNSYKITGTIQRPIRVRVETGAEDELTLATSYSDETITSIDQAVAIGQAQLEQNNSIRNLNFKTNHPGLRAGQSITVTDSARGLAETITINRIGVTWLGSSGHATFNVECGDNANDNFGATLANVDKRTRANGAVTSPDTQTASLYTDDSGNIMTDDSNQYLYEVT
jgi:hypothetical protein